MKIEDCEKRLDHFWGKVDAKHCEIISSYAVGKRILDIGCGYGTLTAHLNRKGLHCTGIDCDADVITIAKRLHPKADYVVASAEDLPFQEATFDCVVLRDSLHHLCNREDFSVIKSNILKVLKPTGRIIVFDPNVHPLLKVMRRIVAHEDEECSFERAIEIIRELNCTVVHSSFNTVYSLPLSGGYVGPRLVPNWAFLSSIILTSESLIELMLNKLNAARNICWRYILVADRNS